LEQVYASTRELELSDLPWSPAQKEAFIRMQFELRRGHYLAHYPEAQNGVITQHLKSKSPKNQSKPGDQAHGQLTEQAFGCVTWQWQNNDLLLIDVALLSAFRGQGIGTALLGNLQAQAHARDCTMTLHVEHTNPAQRLYRRLGFEPLAPNSLHSLMRWEMRWEMPPRAFTGF
jgi:ribosomal protein S18 acetylase RimI-like enzyme